MGREEFKQERIGERNIISGIDNSLPGRLLLVQYTRNMQWPKKNRSLWVSGHIASSVSLMICGISPQERKSAFTRSDMWTEGSEGLLHFKKAGMIPDAQCIDAVEQWPGGAWDAFPTAHLAFGAALHNSITATMNWGGTQKSGKASEGSVTLVGMDSWSFVAVSLCCPQHPEGVIHYTPGNLRLCHAAWYPG